MILENNFDMQIKKYVSWNVLKKSIGYKWKKQSIKSLIRYINSFARANILFCAGFFHTRKKFKNFSKEVIKSHLSFPIWCLSLIHIYPMNEEIGEQLGDIVVGKPETLKDQLKPILSNERLLSLIHI